MARFNDLIFWLGGVLIDTLADQTLMILQQDLSGRARVSYKEEIEVIADELIRGSISPEEYCQRVISVGQATIDIGGLQTHLRERIIVSPDVLCIIQQILPKHSCWLLSDYPYAWIDGKVDEFAKSGLFPRERVIYTANLGLKRICPDIFTAVPKALAKPQADCLIIDGNSTRAVESIKHGLASIIYVYPQRLKHELILQNILEYAPDALHPAKSERIDI